MTRPCYCHKNKPYAAGVCYFCYLRQTNPKYKALWPDSATIAEPTVSPEHSAERLLRFKRKPCKFLGHATGHTVKCKTCTKTMDVPLMACSLLFVCTEKVLAQGYPCCSICDKREDSTE